MAELNISLPSINGLDSDRERKQIKSYLYQLTEQLRYVLNNIDSDNMTSNYNNSVQQIQTLAEATNQAVKDLENHEEVDFKEIYDKIVQMADEITNEYTVAINTTENSILTQVSEEYTAKSATASLEETLMSLIEQTSRDITFKFDQATEYTIEVNGELQRFINEVRTYQRFTADGLEIGQEGSPFQSRFSNTKLSFLQNGVEIAYVSNNKLYITDVEINHKLTIGNSLNGYFDFVPRTNGNLSLKWRES